MEDLALLCLMPFFWLAEALFFLIADLFGLATGLGWRHYSKKRKAAKEAARKLKETFD